MKVLLTGGTGYVGSHTAAVLLTAGMEVVLYDNFCRSSKKVVDSIQKITGKQPRLVEGDTRNTQLLKTILVDEDIDSVIHFAGLKSISESLNKPDEYYDNNVTGTTSLLQAMQESRPRKLVFSSSATVYGDPIYLPIDESHPTKPTNPYGSSKLAVENLLADLGNSAPAWVITSLRYFNPVGAHDSGLIGETFDSDSGNLMPSIVSVATGNASSLLVYGNDYKTPDGTGMRDYIHVMDLAEGHLAALQSTGVRSNYSVFNLGTGTGHTVLEMVNAFESVSGLKIPIEFGERRKGDVDACLARVDKANQELNWKAETNLQQMCNSVWKYISTH